MKKEVDDNKLVPHNTRNEILAAAIWDGIVGANDKAATCSKTGQTCIEWQKVTEERIFEEKNGAAQQSPDSLFGIGYRSGRQMLADGSNCLNMLPVLFMETAKYPQASKSTLYRSMLYPTDVQSDWCAFHRRIQGQERHLSSRLQYRWNSSLTTWCGARKRSNWPRVCNTAQINLSSNEMTHGTKL